MVGRRLSIAAFVAAGLAVAVLLVLLVSPHADADPDGLSKVSADHGIDRTQLPSGAKDSPLAGYAVPGLHHGGLSTGLAGLIGITVTFAIVAGVLWLVRRRRPAPSADRTQA
jgi:ABC-type Fe3+-siderophore transport system permease subunit